MLFTFSKLCTPAMIYFVLGVISLILLFSQGALLFSLLIKAIFVVVWTWLLNYLCSKGYSIISWILVLLPFILMLGLIAGMYETISRMALVSTPK